MKITFTSLIDNEIRLMKLEIEVHIYNCYDYNNIYVRFTTIAHFNGLWGGGGGWPSRPNGT